MDPFKTQTRLPTSPSRHIPAHQEQPVTLPPDPTWSWQGTTGHPAEPPWPEPASCAGDDEGADGGGLSIGEQGRNLLLRTALPGPVPSRRALAPRGNTGHARPHPGERPGHPAQQASPAGDPKLPWGPPDLILEGIPVGCPQAPISRETRQIQSGGWVPEGSRPLPCSKPLRLGGDTTRGHRRSRQKVRLGPLPGFPGQPAAPRAHRWRASSGSHHIVELPPGGGSKAPTDAHPPGTAREPREHLTSPLQHSDTRRHRPPGTGGANTAPRPHGTGQSLTAALPEPGVS